MTRMLIFARKLTGLWPNPIKRIRRYLQRFSVDAYIVSFPKCGRTWLRVMIGKALCLKYGLADDIMLDTPQVTSEAGILPTEFTHDYADNPWRSYSQLPTDKKRYAKQKVIFLTRNVKDVLVSYYFHCTRRSGDFSGDISSFIRSENLGTKKVIAFYNTWYENQNVPLDFLLLKYADMHRDPKEILKQALRFLGIDDIEEHILGEAIAFARFDNMHRMEREGQFGSSRLKPATEEDPESYKTRRGEVGGYVDYLSAEDIDYIDRLIEEMGSPFAQTP